jgi:hypothetical protein
MSLKGKSLRVVVDGSNFATEGRSIPSWAQLIEATEAFRVEYPKAEVIVVVDASFEHRIAASERPAFNEALTKGDVTTPPAGAVGRGDGFILTIADRIGGVVLSNDSFQEFQNDYRWLFEENRLIGGKPVRGVGWIFTPRIPVRATKAQAAVKKLAVALPGGAKPSVGTTLTPVKATKKVAKTQPKKAEAKPVKKAVKKSEAKPVKKPVKAAKKVAAKIDEAPVVMRRGRQPVNPENEFALFRAAYRIGQRVEGEVIAFTSHGAVIKVTLKGSKSMECYAPTASLGKPAPARARDVVKRGDIKNFKLVSVDAERRIAELSLP